MVMKLNVIIIVTFLMVGCSNKKKSNDVAIETTVKVEDDNSSKSDIELEIYDFQGFKKFLNKKDDTVYVINFWATWCAPCVKELPYFEKLNQEYENRNVKVLLVSLDFPHLYDSKLKPFIEKKKLQSKVVALDDVDMNTWIPQVNDSWSGSLPATIIFRNDDSKFFEQSFTYESLENEVKQFIK